MMEKTVTLTTTIRDGSAMQLTRREDGTWVVGVYRMGLLGEVEFTPGYAFKPGARTPKALQALFEAIEHDGKMRRLTAGKNWYVFIIATSFEEVTAICNTLGGPPPQEARPFFQKLGLTTQEGQYDFAAFARHDWQDQEAVRLYHLIEPQEAKKPIEGELAAFFDYLKTTEPSEGRGIVFDQVWLAIDGETRAFHRNKPGLPLFIHEPRSDSLREEEPNPSSGE